MLTKFIHTGDWHFGAGRGRIPDHLKRQTKGVHAVFKWAMKHKIRHVVVAGDLFDGKDTRPDERDALLRLLLHYDGLGFVIIMVNGNHDQATATYTNLRYILTLYQHKKFENLHIATSDTGPQVVTIEKQPFILLPGFHNGDVNVRIAELNKSCDRPPVVVMHEVVKGAMADNGFPLEKGIKLDPKANVLYYAMGDLHQTQQVSKVPQAWYCGSPIQHDFGEKLPKGFLVVDTKKATKPKFVQLNLHPQLLNVKGMKKAKKYADDWIKLIVDSVPDEKELPENILDFDYERKTVTLDDAEIEAQVQEASASPLASLKKYLKVKTHLSKEARKLAVSLADRYYKRAQTPAEDESEAA